VFVLVCVLALVMVHASPLDKSKNGGRSKAKEHKFNKGRPGPNSKDGRGQHAHRAHSAGKYLVNHRQGDLVSACPGPDPQLLEAPVTITSFDYDNYQDCQWQVAVPAGTYIRVQFTSFAVENHYTCSYDSLTIYDAENENGPLRSVLCGHDLPDAFTSLTNHLFIHFTTDYSVTDNGFEMVLSLADTPGEISDLVSDTMLSCPGPRELTGSQVFITSPGLSTQEPYSNWMQCRWLVTVPEDMYAHVEFLFMDVESSCGCWFDSIIVRDGDSCQAPVLGSFCGTDLPAPVTASQNQVEVMFFTDCSVTGAGFNISVTALETPPPGPESLPGCPGPAEVSPDGAEILSFGFGSGGYTNFEACEWRINAEPGQYISLTFLDFAVEHHSMCSYDRLTIFDGPDDTAPSTSLCGSQIPPVFTSVGNSLLLTFTTDYSVTAAGFRIVTSLSDSPGEVLPDNPALSSPGPHHFVLSAAGESATIYSPFYFTTGYRNNEFSSWLIEAPEGMFLRIHFVSLDIENHANCVWDALTVIDGPATTHNLLLQICGSETPADFVTQTNATLLTFTTDGSVTDTGFAIEFTVETEAGHLVNYVAPQLACSGAPLTINAENGTLSSPNFGVEPYDNYAYCQWLFQATGDVTFQLTFTAFSVEYQSSCYYDSVNIYDGPYITSTQIGSYCGSTLPPVVTSTGNSLLVVFETDFCITDLGFSLTYTSTETETRPEDSAGDDSGASVNDVNALPVVDEDASTTHTNTTSQTTFPESARANDVPIERDEDLKEDILREIEKILERRIREQ